jgi:hypothetical protein
MVEEYLGIKLQGSNEDELEIQMQQQMMMMQQQQQGNPQQVDESPIIQGATQYGNMRQGLDNNLGGGTLV